MTIVDKIIEKLTKHPDVRYDSGADYITVHPASDDGFLVSLSVSSNRFTVFFSGWHDDFYSESDALDCFLSGLSENCRLREYRRGNFAHAWVVEYYDNDTWNSAGETDLIFFPFWKKKSMRYLQNHVIPVKDLQKAR